MIVLRKNFSRMQLINTRGTIGFDSKRRYDQDLGRLGDMNTAQRELHRLGDLSAEMRKMRSELNRGKTWQE